MESSQGELQRDLNLRLCFSNQIAATKGKAEQRDFIINWENKGREAAPFPMSSFAMQMLMPPMHTQFNFVIARTTLPPSHSHSHSHSSLFSTRTRSFSISSSLSSSSSSSSSSSIRCCCASSSSETMGGTANTALYPLQRCKTIHFVRHAQGYHNVAGEKDFGAYMSYDYLDAQLTDLGWSQVDNLRMHVQGTGIAKKIELVITSPLLRTMQTAVGVFGGEKYTDGINALPLMIENAFNSGRPAVSTLGAPPFLAVEYCREHLGVHPCDKRRSITEYLPAFPAIDFSLIENEEDVLWKPDAREKNEEVAIRGAKFIDWLWTREEKEIAIVSHSGFLCHTLSNFGQDCHPTIQQEISKHFANCELRSLVLVDRSMIGTPASSTNYPGKIPTGADKPSDQA